MRRTAAMVASWAILATCARRPLGEEMGETGAGGANTGGAVGSGGGGGNGGQTAGLSGTICGTFEHRSARLPPDILILLDASGSMDQDDDMTCEGSCGARSKWARATAAINSLVTQTETTVNWGLKWFPDGTICSLNAGPTVPVAPNNASAIAAAIAGRTSAAGGLVNGGNTPTRTAEDIGARYLTGLTDGNPKFILLVTDGGSNCRASGSPQADDSEGSVQMVASAKQGGIPTIVVGVTMAGSAEEANLNAMAVAGGFARANSPPDYYPLAAAGELTSTLDTLIRVNPDCVFSIPSPPNGTRTYPPIGVKLDGADVPRDTSHTSGWDFTDATFTSVQVYGPACAEVMAGNVDTVSIVFYCRPGD